MVLLWRVMLTDCRDKGEEGVRDPDYYNTTVDTGLFLDTSEPQDTVKDTGDTADTSDTVTDALVESMALFPDGITAHPGATYALRLVGRWDDGVVSNITGAYTSSDESIATVDKDGVVTAHAAGAVTLTATWDALSEQVGLTIVDDGVITIPIVDSQTGSPISDAKVKVFEEDTHTTDSARP